MTFRILPIHTLLYYLTVMFVVATVGVTLVSVHDGITIVRNSVLIFSGAFLAYYVLLKFKFTTKTRVEHRIITCLILSLLFYVDYPWFFYLGLGALVEVLQRVIRFPTGPVFNPAALATVVMSLLHFPAAWWGASFSPRLPILRGGVSVAIFLTVPVGLYVAWKYRKLIIVSAYLLSFILAHILLVHRFPLFITFEGTLLFYLLIMVIEPKTSPVLPKEQAVFGIGLGVLVPMAMRFHLSAPYLMPLLLCNAIFNTYRNRRVLFKPKIQPSVVSQLRQ